MAEGSNAGGGGLLDLEKELTCSICTDILYQPLTLLDCLHTFCGGCSKEWFKWQAVSAASSGRRTTRAPYTCPSCREPVRGTKADWRLTTLLEGYLKANPGKGKAEEEKEEMRSHYKPGDDVLPPVVQQSEEDSEDERLVADVMEMSMSSVDPDTARRRAERAARERQRRRQERGRGGGGEELASYQQNSRRAAQQADRQQDEDERQIEHQPSLRSLLSNSDISSEDVQEEILQSIYSEGLLNGIDIDNLTPAQEEELTERIAEAYRRRQRHRDRSRNRDRQRDSTPPQTEARRTTPPVQQPQTRSRPPISRPHLFEQHTAAGGERNQRRSASSTSHQRARQSESRTRTSSNIAPAARSATDLSETSHRASRPRASSNNARSSTDPPRMHEDVRRIRATSNTLRPDAAEASSRPRSRDNQPSEPARRQTAPTENQSSPATASVTSAPRTDTPPQQSPEVRPAASVGALAPVPVSTEIVRPPSVSCSSCQKPDIATRLHYNCSKCESGNFNLCLRCYREGKGCHNWYGFGTAAWARWQRVSEQDGTQHSLEYPHILTPRKYTMPSNGSPTTSRPELLEGAFCEVCFTHTPTCYWYCQLCLSGAWGYCNACVLRGTHCTHPLLPLAHLSTLHNSSHDPQNLKFLNLPHLKQDSYIPLPVLTDCDICRSPIPPTTPRYHCYECSSGDYDICPECYTSLIASGKISRENGSSGWRRCPQSHRMSIITYHSTPSTPYAPSSQLRITLNPPVGGVRLKEDSSTLSGRATIPAEDSGGKAIANWSFWPLSVDEGGDGHDLSFPRGAEIREVEERNEDWSVGVYCGKLGVFPTNHTMRM